MPETVELHDCWFFSCPECGLDTTIYPARRELIDPAEKMAKLEAIYGDGVFTVEELESVDIRLVNRPDQVQCKHCRLWFPVAPMIQTPADGTQNDENGESGDSGS